jgi:hypothetical protein
MNKAKGRKVIRLYFVVSILLLGKPLLSSGVLAQRTRLPSVSLWDIYIGS